MSETEAWSARITAAILDRAPLLGIASLALAAATLIGPGSRIFAIVTILIGLVQLWFMIRARIDADLFRALAAPGASLERFDDAMSALGLGGANGGARDLAERARSALRFLKIQGLCIGAQALLLAIALLAGS